jgi:hypothetical protein
MIDINSGQGNMQIWSQTGQNMQKCQGVRAARDTDEYPVSVLYELLLPNYFQGFFFQRMHV